LYRRPGATTSSWDTARGQCPRYATKRLGTTLGRVFQLSPAPDQVGTAINGRRLWPKLPCANFTLRAPASGSSSPILQKLRAHTGVAPVPWGIRDPSSGPPSWGSAGKPNSSGQLSPAHREVIDLVYYHEKSIDEVAEITGIPPNTVKTRMFYARKRIAELMATQGIDRTVV
jgi:DNA-binding CsgD family transcriptional regulator